MGAPPALLCTRCGSGACRPDPHGGRLYCERCRAVFPVVGGIVDMLPHEPSRRSAAQAAMEWPPVVAIYESRLWRRNPLFVLLTGIDFDEEAAIILRAAALAEDEQVLDLACGSGNYTRRLARAVPRGWVTAVDLSRAMLEYAADRARAEAIGNVSFVRGNAMALPLPDASIDLANCCAALHLFPDARQALHEVRRVLRPGGRLTTAVFRRDTDGAGAGSVLERVGRSLLGIDSYTPESLETLLTDAGLRLDEVMHDSGLWLLAKAGRPL